MMETVDGEILETSNPPTTPETVTKEEILEGDVKIPVKDIFAFVIQHVTESFGQRMGVGSTIDRNFLYFQQLGFRKRIENIDKYTFLHPLVVEEKKGAPVLVAIKPYQECKNELGESVDKKAFVLYILEPAEKIEDENDLNKFNEIFQSEIRDRAAEQKGLKFSHILASLLECHDGGYIHFTVESQGQDDNLNQWAFEYQDKNLYLFKIPHNPPYEALEMPILSPWISSTQPYFRRHLTSKYHFKFSDEEIELMRSDPDVKEIQTKSLGGMERK